MNSNKFLIGALIGGIVNFFGGWLIYGMALHNAMMGYMSEGAKAMHRPDMNLFVTFISCLLVGVLLALIFERWAGIRTLQSGAMAGAIIMGLFWLSTDLNFTAMTTFYTSNMGIVLDVLAAAVLGGLTGGAIGWWLGYNRK